MCATPSRLKATELRESKQAGKHPAWPREVQAGRAIVRVSRRETPVGNCAYMVANYVDGKRRFGSYAREAKALSAAEMLAKRIDARDYVAASLTQEQAIEYADAASTLKPAGVSVRTACLLPSASCLRLWMALG